MPVPAQKTWHINEDQTVELCALVYGNNAALITQAAIASGSYKSWKDGTQNNPSSTSADSITVASSVFDTLQTDGYWTDEYGVAIDAVGYNFRFTLPASVTAAPGVQIRVEVRLVDTGGKPIPIIWEDIRIADSLWD